MGGGHVLADVLSSERTAACPAFETTDVPLPLQSQQRLTLFDLLATAGAVWRGGETTRGRLEQLQNIYHPPRDQMEHPEPGYTL